MLQISCKSSHVAQTIISNLKYLRLPVDHVDLHLLGIKSTLAKISYLSRYLLLENSKMIDWTGKMWHIYTMEYYAAIKNDEFVSFVGTWMNLEYIILSKLTQEQKRKYHMFSLIGG